MDSLFYSLSGAFFLVMVSLYSHQMWIAWHYEFPDDQLDSAERLFLTVLIPAYNEALVLDATLHSACDLTDADLEILVIDDGSTDDTFGHLRATFALTPSSRPAHFFGPRLSPAVLWQSTRDPRVWVVRQPNGGKAAALNTGIAYSRGDVIITLDADTQLAPTALAAIRRAFTHPTLLAAGGLILPSSPASPPHVPLLARLQRLEYLRGFLLEKFTLGRVNAIGVIAGAFGAFRRAPLEAIGGYHSTLGEDMDVTLRLHQWRAAHAPALRLAFLPDAVAYTQCPATLSALFHQRVRWQKAFVDALVLHHRWLVRHPRLAISYSVMGVMLMMGVLPAFLFLGFVARVVWAPHTASSLLLFTAVSGALMLTQSTVAEAVARRFPLPPSSHRLGTQVQEVLGYRFVTLFFVVAGTLLYFVNHHTWAVSPRTPVDAGAPRPAPVQSEAP